MQSVQIGNNQAGQRLDKFLRKYLPEAGSSFLYKMLRKKNITLNGKKAEGNEMLNIGDEICFFFSDETFAKFSGGKIAEHHSGKHTKISNTETNTENKTQSRNASQYEQAYKSFKRITVLYEDDNILIANKPVGILTQKASPSDLSLNEWLIGYLLATGSLDSDELQTFHPSVCNRLDRNTSGIVLCGKSLAGSQALSRIIKDRTVQKFYRTICVGAIKEDRMLDGYLYKDNATNKVMVINNLKEISNEIDDTKSKQSKTGKNTKNAEFTSIKTAYHPINTTKAYTLLEVELITGRTHQIRAHLSSIGHPLIGDYKYGIRRTNDTLKKQYGLEAQLLHAYKMVFPNNESGVLKALNGKEIIAPCPSLFLRIQEDMGLE